MIVGIGMNGHIGFNEPGTSFAALSHVAELDEITKSVGQKYFDGTGYAWERDHHRVWSSHEYKKSFFNGK
jgi:6-phosphogluconolactonase/glucosamine-6-phosphate isomerase/deaminase